MSETKNMNQTPVSPEWKLLEELERTRTKLAARNYDRAGLAVDEVIGSLISYFKRLSMPKSTDPPTTRFYVVDFRYDDKDVHRDDEKVFTVSTDPNTPGWQTDGGYDGYGLTKSQAQFLVDAANEKIERENNHGFW